MRRNVCLISSVILFALVGCSTSTQDQSELGLNESIVSSTTNILTSPNDPRAYEAITLTNGLRVLLVSDPKAQDSAVTLDIHVGSFDDPDERLGLAHFTEHMLFIGTEKYPEAGDYHQFIEGAGGHSNAYTAGEDTVYFFSVKPYAFEAAVDRFSQFFVSPTFEPTYVERERNAVDSEYHMRFKDDNFRIHAVETRTANPRHPGHRFHAGNRETLSDTKGPVHEDLLAFYQQYYSADKMTLSVVSPHSLQEQKELIVPRFTPVPVKTSDPKETILLLDQKELQQDIYIKPNQQIQRLDLTFPNTIVRDYQTKPMLYVAEMLNSSAEHSLKAWLKNKEWIIDLQASYGDLTDDQNAFSMSFELTNAGVNKVDEITEAFFAYIEFVKESGIQDWVFDEIKAAHVRSFNFEEYTPPSSWSRLLATAMQKHPTEQIIQNAYIDENAVFAPSKIQEVLASMRPDNIRRTIVAQSVSTDKVESYFDVPYATAPISQEKIHQWQKISQEQYAFALDTPNPYLPTHFEMAKVQTAEKPERFSIGKMNAWYQPNIDFDMPKVSTTIGFWTPVAHQTPRESLMTQLFIALLAEEMETQMRHVGKAGASGGISSTPRGLVLNLSSFTDRHDKVCQLFVETMLTLGSNDKERFSSVVDAQRRAFESYHEAPPFVLASASLEKQILIPSWTPDDLLPELDSITLEAVKEHGARLITTAQLEAFVHGNMTKEMAVFHLTTLNEQFSQLPISPIDEAYKPVVRILESGAKVLDHVISSNTDQMVMLNLVGSGPSLSEYLKIALLGRMMGADFFTQLRTEEQLGYVVHQGMSSTMGVPRLTMLVQSPQASETMLMDRVNRFIGEQILTEDGFSKAKQSLLAEVNEPFKMLGAQQQFIWSEIALSRFAFDLKSQMAEALEGLSLADVKAYFDNDLAHPSKRREIQISTIPKASKTLSTAKAA